MRRVRPSCWLLALCGVTAGAAVAADPPNEAPTPPVMSREMAVRFALANNPQLTVARTQRGLARAGVVLARTYPYNPIYQGVILGANGEDVTNHVFNEHYFTVQIELR